MASFIVGLMSLDEEDEAPSEMVGVGEGVGDNTAELNGSTNLDSTTPYVPGEKCTQKT